MPRFRDLSPGRPPGRVGQLHREKHGLLQEIKSLTRRSKLAFTPQIQVLARRLFSYAPPPVYNMHVMDSSSHLHQPAPSAATEASLAVEGMDCASCVSHVQHAAESVPGVESCQVNLARGR